MKKYTFKLERILQLKEHHESEAKLAYAAVLQKKVQLEQQNDSLQKELDEAYKKSFDRDVPGQAVDPVAFGIQRDFGKAVELTVKHNNDKKIDVEKELEKVREKLKEAVKEKKKYEKLKEHDYNNYKDFIKKEEIKLLDDIGVKESELHTFHSKST